MTKRTLYLFRGDTVRMLSLCGFPEDEELKPLSLPSSPTTVPTAIPREVKVEGALHMVQGKHPDADVRILNWHRPKRDA